MDNPQDVYCIGIYNNFVWTPNLLSNGYIKVGGVIQHGIGMSFDCRFRSLKQYYSHKSCIEMSRQMSEL